MPELPEVEAAAVRLRAVMAGRVITAMVAHHPSQRRQLPRAAIARVVGRRVVAIERRGKHQLLHLDNGALLHVHFRMNGDWEFTPIDVGLPRFARVTLDLDSGVRVSLTDSRALCAVRYHAAGHPPALSLGPEADDPALTPSALRGALAGKRGAIKTVLLDQRVMAGVGNIYAGEALWRAKINPAAPAAGLSPAKVAKLLAGVRAALKDGVKHVGSYREGTRTSRFKVYDREGEKCERCGKKIKRMIQGARSTYYCPVCQR